MADHLVVILAEAGSASWSSPGQSGIVPLASHSVLYWVAPNNRHLIMPPRHVSDFVDDLS